MRDRNELKGSAANKIKNLFTPPNQEHKETTETLDQHLEQKDLQSNTITSNIKALGKNLKQTRTTS